MARDAVRWCVDNGILNGVGGNRMTPQDLARRGQVAAMLMQLPTGDGVSVDPRYTL